LRAASWSIVFGEPRSNLGEVVPECRQSRGRVALLNTVRDNAAGARLFLHRCGLTGAALLGRCRFQRCRFQPLP
jgi:hypothetical protein